MWRIIKSGTEKHGSVPVNMVPGKAHGHTRPLFRGTGSSVPIVIRPVPGDRAALFRELLCLINHQQKNV